MRVRLASPMNPSVSQGKPGPDSKRDDRIVPRFERHGFVICLTGNELMPCDEADVNLIVTLDNPSILRAKGGDPRAVSPACTPINSARRRQLVEIRGRSAQGLVLVIYHLDRELSKGIVLATSAGTESRNRSHDSKSNKMMLENPQTVISFIVRAGLVSLVNTMDFIPGRNTVRFSIRDLREAVES